MVEPSKGAVAVNRTKVLEAAQKFLSKGQFDKAIAEYQKLVAEDPRDVRTLLKIGDLHTRRNKPKDAIDVYTKVAELYAKQGFFLKAVAVYKQILKLEPTHVDSSQRLAKMYEELGLTNDALTTYEQVADGYMAQGQMPKALETMERMVELDGQNVAVRIKLAEALSKADRPKDAARAFAAGAQLLKEQGRIDDYIRVVERQLYHDPENLDIARSLASLYLERQDPKRALTKLQVCFKADPRDIQTLEMLAEAFRQLGQIPKTVSVLKEIARLHGEVGAQEPRRRTLQRVLDLDPHDAEARQGLSGGTGAGPAPRAPAPAAAPQPRQPAPVPTPARIEAPAAAPKPAPAPAARVTPAPVEQEDDDVLITEDSTEELDVLEAQESDDDEVMIVDEASGETPAVELEATPEELLDRADALEAEGNTDAAEGVLKGLLADHPDHLEAHERLKDLYLATDRRVDAVRELLWLSDAWTERNPERAIQHARAAYDLAPNAEATRRRLQMLGAAPSAPELPVSEPAAADEDVMFVDEPQPTLLERPRDAADDELDAILPPVSLPPEAGPASSRPASQARSLASSLPPPARAYDDEEPERNLLDLPISPDEFDAPVPARKAALAPVVFSWLEEPLDPAGFTGESDDLNAGEPQAMEEMATLLDSPISPDEFDAVPPPRRRPTPISDAAALLEAPVADDFGLSDERFDRSGMTDVEAPLPSLAPASISPAEVLPADDDAPSIEFAEIGTGEVDVSAASAEFLLDDERAQPAEGSVTLPPNSAGEAALAAEQGAVPAADDFLDDADLGPAPEPTVPGAPIPDLLLQSRAKAPDQPPVAAPLPEVPPLGTPQPGSPKPAAGKLPAPFAARAPLPAAVTPKPAPAPAAVKEPAVAAPAPQTPLASPPAPVAAKPAPQPAPAPANAAPVPQAAPVPAKIAPAPQPTPAAAKPAPAPQPAFAVAKPAPLPAPAPVAAKPAAPQPAAVAPKPAAPEAEVVSPEIEEVLDEADFFASQGMMDEALEVVQEAILIYPASKALRARLLEYEAKADAQDEAAEQAAENADESFDIAEQLAGELASVPAPQAAEEMVDVESVFAQFKKGVAAQISPEDSETHFDLGIAYKEMGLTQDAIQEFELAAKNPKRACTALTMIGMCYLEKSDPQQAVAYFENALSSPVKSAAEEIALLYEVGNAKELIGMFDAALAAFEKVAAQDRNFRGVSTRLDGLRKRGASSAMVH